MYVLFTKINTMANVHSFESFDQLDLRLRDLDVT
jgi:hypothetical protein